MLVQNTVTRRKSGADSGYVYTEVVMVSVIQQTRSPGKIISQTLRKVILFLSLLQQHAALQTASITVQKISRILHQGERKEFVCSIYHIISVPEVGIEFFGEPTL